MSRQESWGPEEASQCHNKFAPLTHTGCSPICVHLLILAIWNLKQEPMTCHSEVPVSLTEGKETACRESALLCARGRPGVL